MNLVRARHCRALTQEQTVMSQTRKPRGVRASEEGLKKLQQAKAAGRDEDGKPLTYERIAERARVDKKTVERFFRREAKDRDSAIAIVQSLGLDIIEVVDPKEWNPVGSAAEGINWRDVCGKVLAQQREKQNFRRSITGRHLGHEAKNVYVKLGLVKPKEQPRRGDEFQPSADRGMLQYQLTEKEIEQEYQYDEFLEQVIEGKEKNLTIFGEPGAGKSTWLEQIALYVDDSNNGFPICISLASLGGKNLEEYLFQIWLKNALRISQCDVSITSAQKKLEELFKSGKVWLLLDGVDEMKADESPLQAIATQLEGWGDLARVVLTCRSNVWEANPNALVNFEMYRTLHFDDEQVGDFIQQWFTQEGKPKLGEELETKLDETRNARIRDLIKNPLRLAMLCGIWYFHQGDLPKTKATLYQQYIEYFYRWKQHPQLTDDLDKQEELHAAFSKLALEAIDKKLPLRRKFAHKVMGKSLFQLARDVGWLNWVYKDAERGEDVYAFFHLTFQEYFAACAIDDWHFFLNHDNENPNPLLNPNPSLEYDNGKPAYRIFEPQWKEVILLWLGREQKVEKEEKEELIKALMEFEDGCGSWYWYRAWFLAAEGIAEFWNCSLVDEIVEQIINWSFGYFDTEKRKWVKFLDPLQKRAWATLQETDSKRAITALSELVQKAEDESICRQAAEELGKIDKGNPLAIEALIELLQTAEAQYLRCLAAASLGAIDKGNPLAIEALIELLQSSECPYWAARSLGQIDKGNPVAIEVLIGLLKTAENDSTYRWISSSLKEVAKDSPVAINALIELLQIAENDSTRKEAMLTLSIITNTKDNPEVIETLIRLLQTAEDASTRKWAMTNLGLIAQDNPLAIETLIGLLETIENVPTLCWIITSLLCITESNSIVIEPLIRLIKNSTDLILATSKDELPQGVIKYLFIRESVTKSLIQIAKNYLLPVIEALIELWQSDDNFQTREFALEGLVEIAKDNPVTIHTLKELRQAAEDESICKLVAICLWEINKDNFVAIQAPMERQKPAKSTEDVSTCEQPTDSSVEVDEYNPVLAILSLIVQIQTAEKWDIPTREYGIANLRKILQGDSLGSEKLQVVVAGIKFIFAAHLKERANLTFEGEREVFSTSCIGTWLVIIEEDSISRYPYYYEIIWHCAQNLPYPDFYQAWQ